jgi:type IV pilus assembly protein PilA
MLTNLRSKIQKDEEGFTLVELMVVVLIMAILMAIAIPTFLGAQNKAKDSSTKADLRNALTVAKAQAADNGGVFDLTAAAAVASLGAAEPSLSFNTASSTVNIAPFPSATGSDITLVKLSKGGKYFAITSTSAGVTKSCSAATEAAVDSNSECVTLSSSTSWTS